MNLTFLTCPLVLVLVGCSTPVEVAVYSQPGGSSIKRSWEIPLDGVRKVELRAGQASSAKVTHDGQTNKLVLGGELFGGAAGYHPAPELSDKPWKETPASEWGLDFKARRYGKRLVISSSDEISFMHHRYGISHLEIVTPPDVQVKLVNRKLSGDGAPDLSR